MSMDRAEAAVEMAIAKHVANSFQRTSRDGKPDTIVVQVRNRITDSFQPSDFQTEQDNQPPALVALYRRIAAAFTPTAREPDTSERTSRLSDIKGSLETLRGALPSMAQRSRLDHARGHLLIERQQLLVKNEMTEGFGRIETWVLSFAFLGLVLLDAVSILWALPFLGLSICRAWYLDRQCKRRLKKIADIDALLGRIERAG
ncbi:hypothetical protein [Microvirga sp. VF16]|uniref:hypothetical protein n=1 Tax=Microvirga sp. VF16 TaxID=2807101 RepID=UPI00193CE166|nr:hypothetical protein [Microvirga sp. VF16]QRM30969.1 hypothetical protein JO965_08240 [Microvirga sp. VF16]